MIESIGGSTGAVELGLLSPYLWGCLVVYVSAKCISHFNCSSGMEEETLSCGIHLKFPLKFSSMWVMNCDGGILAYQGVRFVLGLSFPSPVCWAIISVSSMKQACIKLNISLEGGEFWSNFPPRIMQLNKSWAVWGNKANHYHVMKNCQRGLCWSVFSTRSREDL